MPLSRTCLPSEDKRFLLLLITKIQRIIIMFMILDTCPSPPTIAHGSHNGNDFTSGTSVTYSCNKQYVLEGSAVIRCVHRQWIGQVPVCKGIDL